jgi:hypothetical protein
MNRSPACALFMNLIHTADLCGANSFDYLTGLQRHCGSNWQTHPVTGNVGPDHGFAVVRNETAV